MTSREELEILYEAEAAGNRPGTPSFDVAVRSLRVQVCRDLNAVAHCSSCPKYFDCELIKQHLRDKAGL